MWSVRETRTGYSALTYVAFSCKISFFHCSGHLFLLCFLTFFYKFSISLFHIFAFTACYRSTSDQLNEQNSYYSHVTLPTVLSCRCVWHVSLQIHLRLCAQTLQESTATAATPTSLMTWQFVSDHPSTIMTVCGKEGRGWGGCKPHLSVVWRQTGALLFLSQIFLAWHFDRNGKLFLRDGSDRDNDALLKCSTQIHVETFYVQWELSLAWNKQIWQAVQ